MCLYLSLRVCIFPSLLWHAQCLMVLVRYASGAWLVILDCQLYVKQYVSVLASLPFLNSQQSRVTVKALAGTRSNAERKQDAECAMINAHAQMVFTQPPSLVHGLRLVCSQSVSLRH